MSQGICFCFFFSLSARVRDKCLRWLLDSCRNLELSIVLAKVSISHHGQTLNHHTLKDSSSKGLVPKPPWHLTSALMDRGSGMFSIFHCKLTLNRGRARCGLFFHPSPWSGSDRQASVPPGADKSPVNQTAMLGHQISTVAHNDDVQWTVSWRTVRDIPG